MPNRARSCRGPPAATTSMAQQASPKNAGHTDRARAYPAAFSTVVSRNPLGSFSSQSHFLVQDCYRHTGIWLSRLPQGRPR